MIQQPFIRFIFVILCLNSSIAKSQILPITADLSYLYQPNAELELSHQIVSSSNIKWLLLEINYKDIPFDSLAVSFSFTEKLETPLSQFKNLNLSNYLISESGNIRSFAIELNQTHSSFMVLSFADLNTVNNYTYIINIKNPASFYITKTPFIVPLLNGYGAKDAIIKLATLQGTESHFNVMFYSTYFQPALPPMAISKQSNPFSLPDTTYQVVSGSKLPTNINGVYSIYEVNQEDEISFFRIVDNNYPQLTNINELIEASIYLFTKNEKEDLDNSSTPKKDYDAFWLENTHSPEKASKMISIYFSRVKEANINFTSFKEGWKTDMGMIYIIFGQPNKVFRTNNGMQWVYKKTYELPEIKFNFYNNKSILTSEYYVLERNVQFQSIWFRVVDLWRKGRKNL